MRSGKLRYRVLLQRRSESQAGSGAVAYTYSDIAEVAAEIIPGRGREFFAAAQIVAQAPAEIRIRYSDRFQLDETCRVVHVKRHDSPEVIDIYDIKAPPVPDAKTGRHDWLLYCDKTTADGWRD